LSTLLATPPAGGAAGCPWGGKSRGLAPRLVLVGQPGGYVRDQPGLVVLGEEEVVALAVDHLLAEIALAEHRVAGDDAALDRQDAQQLEGGLVIVGLGVHPDLSQDGLGVLAVGGDEVLPRDIAVPAAAGGLAVQVEDQLGVGGQAGGDPGGQGGLEGGDVEAAEEDGEGGLGGGLAAPEAQHVSQGEALVAAELGDGLVALGTGEQGEDGEGEDGGQRVAPSLAGARVGDLGEGVEQGKGGRHPKGLRD
jgi:hypothetical protein